MFAKILHFINLSSILTILFATSSTSVTERSGLYKLGTPNICRDRITVSGFSSGGTFAQHMQISFSSLIRGIAVFSHAYYRCGPGDGSVDNYDNACTLVGPLGPTSPQYNPDLAVADIRSYATDGFIDNPINLLNQPLYVYAGTRNSLFALETSLGILSVYEPFIQNVSAIRTRVQPANLVLPTNNFGRVCSQDASNNLFLANCGFSGAYEALNFILGGGLLEPQRNQVADRRSLVRFDQTEFFYGLETAGPHFMDDEGFMYLPKACKYKECLLHFYFHGCSVGREFTGSSHIVNSGYLEVAELNDIIIVFPQVLSSAPENVIGCWDTFGLTGKYYATRRGHQLTIVRNILARLMGEDHIFEHINNYLVSHTHYKFIR